MAIEIAYDVSRLTRMLQQLKEVVVGLRKRKIAFKLKRKKYKIRIATHWDKTSKKMKAVHTRSFCGTHNLQIFRCEFLFYYAS